MGTSSSPVEDVITVKVSPRVPLGEIETEWSTAELVERLE